MRSYEIVRLDTADYHKCGNIWDMTKQSALAEQFYDEILADNRVVYVCVENGDFIGEGALVFDNGDPDYTIPERRVYLSRMIVKAERRGVGIGSAILDFLIDKASELGFEEMTVGVDKSNVVARHLYESNGFDTVIFDGVDEHGEYVKLLKTL
jgi:Acetyltransferases